MPIFFLCTFPAGQRQDHHGSTENTGETVSLCNFAVASKQLGGDAAEKIIISAQLDWLSPPQPQTFWLIETLPAKLHQVFAECRPPQRIFIMSTLNTPSCSRTRSTREVYGAKHMITVLQNFSATFAVTSGMQFVVTREV